VPRAIWSGNISFGLVNAPVRMFAAIDEHDLDLHLVHEPDGGRIGYLKVCKLEEKPVPADEIVKAVEVDDGELVYLTDEDFEAAQEEGYRAIEILDFVPYEQIDPIYFERSFYLGPQDGAEKVYALLVRAMERAGLAAISRYVFHDRQQLGCLRVRDGVITLEKMYFADEIRPHEELAPKGVRVDARELEAALALIEGIAGGFEPERYEDVYRERLLDVVRRKRKGEEVHRRRPEKPEEPTDLLAALRESVDAIKRGGKTSNGGRRTNGRDGGGALEDLTVDELRERARKRDVKGRSGMSKRELVRALRKQGD
jgi:DNA end-binding protein Ku